MLSHYIEYEYFKLMEHFCVVIYDNTSNLEFVNQARKELFVKKWNDGNDSTNTRCFTAAQ